MKIKILTEELPEGFVDIHNLAFQGFFLTSLGSNFLNLYYNSLLKSNKGIIICLYNEDDNLIGFAAGTNKSKGFHKKILLENIFSFTWVLLNIIVSRPIAILRLFKNLNKNKNIKKDDGRYAELLSIAVPPEYIGKGYGKILLREFEIILKSSGIEKIALTTDYYNNEGVLTFYNNAKYEIFYDFIAFPNRRMYKLIKKL